MAIERIQIEFQVNSNLGALATQVKAVNAQIASLAASTKDLTDIQMYGERGMSGYAAKINAATTALKASMLQGNAWGVQQIGITTRADKFTESLKKGKITAGQALKEWRMYRRESTRGMSDIQQAAMKQVRLQQSITASIGPNAAGQQQALAFIPNKANLSAFGYQAQLAAAGAGLVNETLKIGSTQLVNWGKNMQWAGRQLMVGMAIPLMILGGIATRTFRELDQELVRLQKVYGEGFTFGDDFARQSEEIRKTAIDLSGEMARNLGVAQKDTVSLMADLAAAGMAGNELTEATRQTTRLAILGEVDRQEAMKATIAIQTAFKVSNDELANSVNFLNAVENQTSTSLADLVEAIPRAGSVVKGLGGDIKDLALYMTAMREGGISANQAANALKSGLVSIINPSTAAVKALTAVGIDINAIVKANQGELTPTIIALKDALEGVDELTKTQIMGKLFGKQQVNRWMALFDNIGEAGSQTLKVLELMGMSTQTLAQTADQEIKAATDSASGRFKRMVATIQAELVPLGESLLNFVTVLGGGLTKFLDFMNGLPGWVKQLGLVLVIASGLSSVILMLVGLSANFIGNFAKGLMTLRTFFQHLGNKLRGLPWNAGDFELLDENLVIANAHTKQLTEQTTHVGDAWDIATQKLRNYIQQLDLIQREMLGLPPPGASGFGGVPGGGRPRSPIGGPSAYLHTPQEYWEESTNRYKRRASGDIERGTITYPSKQGPTTVQIDNRAAATLGESLMLGAIMRKTTDIKKEPIKGGFDPHTGEHVLNITKLAQALGQTPDQIRKMTLAMAHFIAEEARLSANLGSVYAGSALFNKTGPQQRDITISALVQDMTDSHVPLADQQKIAALMKNRVPMLMAIASDEQLFAAIMDKQINAYQASNQGVELDTAARQQLTKATLQEVKAFEDQLSQSIMAGGKGSPRAADLFKETQLWKDSIIRETDGRINVAKTLTAINAKLEAEGRTIDLTDQARLSELDALIKVQDALGRQVQQIDAATKKAIAGKYGKTGVARVQIGEYMANVVNPDNPTLHNIVRPDNTEVGWGKNNAERARLQAQFEEELRLGKIKLDYSKQEVQDKAKVAASGKDEVASSAVELQNEEQQVQAERAKTTEGQKQVGLAKEETAIEGAGVPAAGRKKGIFGGVGNLGKMGAGVMSAGMIASSLAMYLPQGGALGNIGGAAGMGVSMGMMAGPWGMLAGGVIGGVVGAFNELRASTQRLNETMAKTAKSYSATSIKVDKSVIQSFGGKPVTPNLDITPDPMLGQKITTVSQEFAQKITDGFNTQIEAVKNVGTEQAASIGQQIYGDLLLNGVPKDTAKNIVQEIMRQADKESVILDIQPRLVNMDKMDTKALAQQQMNLNANNNQDLLRQINEAQSGGLFGNAGFLGTGMGAQTDFSGQYKAMGQNLASTFMTAFQQGLYNDAQGKFDPKMMVSAATEKINAAARDIFKANKIDLVADFLGESTKDDAVAQGIRNRIREYIPNIDDIHTVDEFTQAYLKLNNAQRAGLMKGVEDQGYHIEGALKGVELVSDSLTETIKRLNPELAATISNLQAGANGASGYNAALQLLLSSTTGRARQQEALDNLVASQKSLIEGTKVQAETEEQRQKRLEKLREAESEALDALRKKQEKRQKAMQDEIDATRDRYDAEIDKIRQAADAKQAAMDREEELARRAAELRNDQISYQEAIAGGDLFAAQRIKNDMAMKQQQWATEDEKKAAEDTTEAKIKKIEAERDTKIKAMEDALEKQREADQLAMESAQKASEARIKAAEEVAKVEASAAAAREKELDDFKTKTESILNDTKLTWSAKIKEILDIATAASIPLADALTIPFGEAFKGLPADIKQWIVDGVKREDWSMLGKLMAASTRLDPALFATYTKYLMSGTPVRITPQGEVAVHGNGGWQLIAQGGMVRGPGTETSDSIPAKLSKGEYVVKARSVRKYGKTTLDAINQGRFDPEQAKFAEGGFVSPFAAMAAPLYSELMKDAYMGAIASVVAAAYLNPLTPMISDSLGEFKMPPGSGTVQSNINLGRQMAQSMYGWTGREWVALYKLWMGESGWRHTADNPYSSAYGIPQALPGSKMASEGADWRTNPVTQIRWGLKYIKNRRDYGSPSIAYAKWLSRSPHWYKEGGMIDIPSLKAGGVSKYDNVIANLHKDETVLTAPLSKKLNDNIASNSEINYNVKVVVGSVSPATVQDVEDAVYRAIEKKEIKLGYGRRIGR